MSRLHRAAAVSPSGLGGPRAAASGDSGKRREKNEVGGDVGAAGRAGAPVKGKLTTISIQLELFGRSGHYGWDLRTHSKGEEGLEETG
jgi:hypothetical protein